MTVLALDLATKLGFAVADPDTYVMTTALEIAVEKPPQPLSGVFHIKPRDKSGIGEFLAIYEAWLLDMIGVHQPDCVVFEAPFITPKLHQDTARKLLGLAAITEKVCHQAAPVKQCFEANNATVRKHFIHKGRGTRAELKALTIAECRARGWTVLDDNEADALALLDHAIYCFGRPGRRAAA